VAGQPR
jgi:hypothetical protein